MDAIMPASFRASLVAVSSSEKIDSTTTGSMVSGIFPGVTVTFVAFVDCSASADATSPTGPSLPSLSSADLASSVRPKVPSVQFSKLTLKYFPLPTTYPTSQSVAVPTEGLKLLFEIPVTSSLNRTS